jgi:IS30 family transposase
VSQIATLVERTTRYVMLVRIPYCFPKGTDHCTYTQVHLDAVADELNDRPRKTLGWRKPTEVLNKLLLDSHTAH